MDLLLDGLQRAAAMVGAAANAVASVMPRAESLSVLALLIGAMLADVLIVAGRNLRRTTPPSDGVSGSDWRRLTADLSWLLAYWLMFLGRVGEDRSAYPGLVAFAAAGVLLRCAGPPIARALRLDRILAWVTAPLAFLTRAVGRLLAFVARPVVDLLGRLPRPSPFQFAIGATLAGCAVLTGLLVKTLLRL